MKTLKQFADELGVHPYDIVGDSEEAQDLLTYGDNIEGMCFYEDIRHDAIFDCENISEHNRRLTSKAGNDVCFNCGF